MTGVTTCHYLVCRRISRVNKMPWQWQRPMEGYPRVWMEFTNEKTKQKFVIKDLSPAYYDITLGYMSNIFLKESAICKPLNILEDPVSRQQMQQKWLKIMRSNMAIVCLSDDDEVPRVAAIHLTAIRERGQEVIIKQGSLSKYDQFIRVVEELMAAGNLFHRFGADRFLSSLGLFVLPEFRGLGIATQLLKSRLVISKALGLPGTANVFSTPGACAAARKAGYAVLAERDFYGEKLALMGTAVGNKLDS